MTTIHLSEEELQQYAEELPVTPAAQQHLQACATCLARLEAYRLLYTAIGEQEAPVFDFDVASLVLPQLPVPAATPAPANDKSLFYLAVIPVIAFVSAAVIFFWNDLLLVFTNKTFTSALIAVMAVPVIAIQGIEMYRSYQRKMRALDLY